MNEDNTKLTELIKIFLEFHEDKAQKHFERKQKILNEKNLIKDTSNIYETIKINEAKQKSKS